MRERAAAIDVAQRPDAGNVRRKLVVDFDEAALVGRDSRALKAEIVGVRYAADGKQEMRADDVPRLLVATHVHGDVLAAALGGETFGIKPYSGSPPSRESIGPPATPPRPRARRAAAPRISAAKATANHVKRCRAFMSPSLISHLDAPSKAGNPE